MQAGDVKIERFLGLRNTDRADRLPMGALVTANHVDLDDTGAARSRRGFALETALSGLSSAYATKDELRSFLVTSGDLKERRADGTLVTLASGLPDGEYFWTEAGNKVIFAGPSYGEIENGLYRGLTIPTPEQPQVDVGAGNLKAGRYLVTYVLVDSDGRQGGAPAPTVVDVEDDSGITITLPYSAQYKADIYVSTANNPQVYFLLRTADPTYFWAGGIGQLVYPLEEEQQQVYPPPDNPVGICFHESQLWVAEYMAAEHQTVLRSSKPFFYHLFDLQSDFFVVPGKVLDLASIPSGMVIGTDKQVLVWTPEDSLQELADYGVVPGRSIAEVGDGSLWIWTTRGAASFPPFKNQTQETVSVPPGTRCSSAIFRDVGFDRFVVLTDGQGAAYNAVI